MILLITLAAYLIVGFGIIAPRWVTHDVEDTIRRCPTLAKEPGRIDEWRREAAGFSIGIALIWPLQLLSRALTAWIATEAPPTSHELKTFADQQAQRIAELERELGITTEDAR